MTQQKEMPIGWLTAEASAVCAIEMGQSPPSSTYNENGEGLPFFQGKAEFGDLYPTIRKWCSSPVKIANKGDVLLSVRAPVGPTNFAPEKCCIGRGLAALSPEKGISSRYVLYAMRILVEELVRQSTGSTFDAITKNIVVNFPLPIAPTAEQIRIISKIEELFSKLDAGVAALKRAKANLKLYRASVLKTAVAGKLTEAWRDENPDQEPASKLLERILAQRSQKWEQEQLAKFQEKGQKPPKNWKNKYKEPFEPNTTNLPDLPEGWCWATLSQIGILDRGKSRHRPRNAPQLYGGPYPFVQTGDVKHADTFIRSHTQTYSEAGLEQSRLWPRGTLCITIAANIADTAILDFEGCFPDSVVGFLPAHDEISTRFVELYIRTVRAYLEALAPATAQKNINLEVLNQVAICLAPFDEQIKLVELVDEKLSVAKAASDQIEKDIIRAGRLRQAILKQAFEGRIVPQDPNDESADKLLERIRAERAKAKAPVSVKKPKPRLKSRRSHRL